MCVFDVIGIPLLRYDEDPAPDMYKCDFTWKNQRCGFRTGPRQAELYKHRRWLEAGNFESIVLAVYRKQRHSYCDLRLCFRICIMLVFS